MLFFAKIRWKDCPAKINRHSLEVNIHLCRLICVSIVHVVLPCCCDMRCSADVCRGVESIDGIVANLLNSAFCRRLARSTPRLLLSSSPCRVFTSVFLEFIETDLG